MSDPVRLRSSDPPDEPPYKETIDLIYDRLSGVAEAQLGDQSDLDGKMVQVFTGASVVMGFSGLTAATATSNPVLVATFLGLALAAYVLVAVATGLVIWTAKFQVLRFGSSLWEEEWDQTAEQVKRAVISRVKTAYDTNLEILNDKGNLLKWGIVSTGIEVAFVAVAIILRVLS